MEFFHTLAGQFLSYYLLAYLLLFCVLQCFHECCESQDGRTEGIAARACNCTSGSGELDVPRQNKQKPCFYSCPCFILLSPPPAHFAGQMGPSWGKKLLKLEKYYLQCTMNAVFEKSSSVIMVCDSWLRTVRQPQLHQQFIIWSFNFHFTSQPFAIIFKSRTFLEIVNKPVVLYKVPQL